MGELLKKISTSYLNKNLKVQIGCVCFFLAEGLSLKECLEKRDWGFTEVEFFIQINSNKIFKKMYEKAKEMQQDSLREKMVYLEKKGNEKALKSCEILVRTLSFLKKDSKEDLKRRPIFYSMWRDADKKDKNKIESILERILNEPDT